MLLKIFYQEFYFDVFEFFKSDRLNIFNHEQHNASYELIIN